MLLSRNGFLQTFPRSTLLSMKWRKTWLVALPSQRWTTYCALYICQCVTVDAASMWIQSSYQGSMFKPDKLCTRPIYLRFGNLCMQARPADRSLKLSSTRITVLKHTVVFLFQSLFEECMQIVRVCVRACVCACTYIYRVYERERERENPSLIRLMVSVDVKHHVYLERECMCV